MRVCLHSCCPLFDLPVFKKESERKTVHWSPPAPRGPKSLHVIFEGLSVLAHLFNSAELWWRNRFRMFAFINKTWRRWWIVCIHSSFRNKVTGEVAEFLVLYFLLFWKKPFVPSSRGNDFEFTSVHPSSLQSVCPSVHVCCPCSCCLLSQKILFFPIRTPWGHIVVILVCRYSDV